MKKTTLLAATGLLAGSLAPVLVVAAPAAGAGAAPSCQGEAATHVGRPNRRLLGTRGRDVVVTNGASFVRTRGGDDLVCITRGSFTQVFTGGGDDRVVNTQARTRGWAALGSGADVYRGSKGPDTVYSMRMPGRVPDKHRDRINTRGGKDQITTGGTDLVNDDVVRGGAGDDELWVVSWDNTGARLDGGEGVDHLWMMRAASPSTGAWVFDTAAGHITRDGRRVGQVAAWESWNVSGLRGDSQEFRGSDADETVWLSTEIPTSATMGAGDDTIGLTLASPTVRAGLLDGSSGTDRMVLSEAWGATDGTFLGDLASQALSLPATDGTVTTIDLAGIEDLSMSAVGSVTITGSSGDNRLFGYSCDTRIDGGAGNDLLASDGFVEDADCAKPATLLGGDGDDVLKGSRFDDVLVGGAGVDRADGGRGTDTCDAEQRENCEG